MNVLMRVVSRLKTRLLSSRKAILLTVALIFGASIATGVHAADLTDTLLSYGGQIIRYGIAFLGLVFSALAWGVGKFIIIVISMLIVPILGYNNFGNSNVVTIGWALVRDVVNMFVIVILLIIAVQTMLGLGRIDWRQQLPRFFIAVVAVNFSKTITLFIIDIGQVIMFTFVNALQEVAAGNFVNLFQVSSFFDLADSSAFQSAINDTGGYSAAGFLASSYLTLVLLSMVLIILLMMSLIFIYRIVVLWVLIILSPIAFFAAGVGNTLASFGGQYAEWWKRLIGAVSLGPILTFFLWLALASASQGAIADTEGFDTSVSPEAGSATSIYTEAFEVDKLLSIFLAMVLLTVGFQAASAQASALGGPAASLITQDTGQRLLKGAAAAPARLSGRVARRGVAEAEGRLAGTRFEGLRPSAVTGGLARQAANLRERGGIVGRTAGTVLGAGVGVLERGVGGLREEQVKRAEESTKGYSDTQRYTEYDDIAEGRAVMPGRTDERAVLAGKLATDKNEQKKYKGYLKDRGFNEEQIQGKFDRAMQQSLKFTEDNKDLLVGDDKSKKESFFKSKSANLDKLYTDLPEEERFKEVMDHVTDDDFKTSQLSADSVKDPLVQRALKQTTAETYTDFRTGEEVTKSHWDKVVAGKGVSAQVREVATKQEVAARSAGPDLTEANAQAITEALRGTELNVGDISLEQLQGENGGQVFQGMLDAAGEGIDLSGLADDVKGRLQTVIGDVSDIADPVQQSKARRALYSATNDPSHLGVQPDGSVAEGARITLANTIKNNPETVVNLNQAIQQATANNQPNAVTNEIVRNVDPAQLQGLVSKFETASEDQREQLRDAITSIQSAIGAEAGRPQDAAERVADKDLQRLQRSASRAQSLMS